MEKKKRRNKSDLGDDFVAPDGGWGWIVCLAAGLIVLTMLPIWQSFGLIFRDRLIHIGLTNSEITTIINVQPAVTSCIGLFSGAIFRRFSYRQVSVFSGIFVSIGILLASISYSFLTYIFSLSIIFGSGMGLGTISTFIAINTYFQKKRRRARSFALTISSIGGIFVPHLANYLILHYQVEGTVMIFGAISMHSFAFALLYQPVEWHSKKMEKSEKLLKPNELNNESTSIEVCYISEKKYDEEMKFEKNNELLCPLKDDNNFKEININKDINSFKENIENDIKNNNLQDKSKLKFLEKFTKFFDLDLLNDLIYVNLIIGITLSGFSEQNFSLLIPFFLSDFQFTKHEIASAMSVLAMTDLLTRFLIPFVTDKINWNNRIFFLIGGFGGTVGRIIIANIPSFDILLIMFGFMGICKAFRVIFVGLVIPDHVPLKRLPAAVGLRQFSNGIFTIFCGPIVGVIRDSTDSTFMLYFLSFISLIPVITWSIEMIYTHIKNRKQLNKTELQETKGKCDIIYNL